MTVHETPVLIVGGGAAGTMLGLELARRGVAARTVDRLSAPARTSRAITVHARTAELFGRLDPALLERFLDRGIANRGYVLHFVDAEGRRSEVRPGIDFSGLDSRHPYILIHRQDETERNLREYAQARFGHSVEWGTECVAVEPDADGVTATLLHRDDGDREERVRCRYLVACDGVNSRVRDALALPQEESEYRGTVLQNLDVFLHGFPDADDWVHYCAGTDHFVMIVKLPGGFHRLLLSDRGEAADPKVPAGTAFMNLVDRHFDGVTLGEVVWHSRWESRVRLAHTYRHGNVFLAGDSAHVHSTTGGQGMNCCLHDAANLGWKLALVLQGHAVPALLDSYERERRPIAEQVIWAASSLHEIFMGHGKDIRERAARLDDPGFLDAVVGTCSGIGYTYRRQVSAACAEQGLTGPLPGDRAPDVDLDGGATLYELLRHTGFTLLALHPADDEPAALERTLAPLRERCGGLLRSHRLPLSPALEAAYGGRDDASLYVVRPDGCIGFRGSVRRPSEAEAWFAGVLRHGTL